MSGTISPRYMNYIPGEIIRAGFRNQGAKAKGDLSTGISESVLKLPGKLCFLTRILMIFS